jgi:hypothetical protein
LLAYNSMHALDFLTLLDTHPKRAIFQVPCGLECGETMPEEFRAAHEARLCVRRPEPCENCGMVLLQQDLADHKVMDCPGFLRACPTGCGAKVRPARVLSRARSP